KRRSMSSLAKRRDQRRISYPGAVTAVFQSTSIGLAALESAAQAEADNIGSRPGSADGIDGGGEIRIVDGAVDGFGISEHVAEREIEPEPLGNGIGSTHREPEPVGVGNARGARCIHGGAFIPLDAATKREAVMEPPFGA